MADSAKAKDEVDRLREENAKLRDLVRRMWSCYGYEEQGCATCYYYGCNECEPMWDACEWEYQMWKLGIEVE